jgi:alpha-D-ribose 1-methylphosphonate 5-triphosphate synthase subunit PhnH
MTRALEGGFADPAVQGARAFRAVMQAMATPGRILAAADARPPAPLSPAAGTVLLTLADATTPLFLAPGHDTPAVRDWIAFHTGAPVAEAGAVVFALGGWAALQPVDRFSAGTPEYPDGSVTLIVEVPRLVGEGMRLTGPGLREHAWLSLPEAAAFQANHARFPQGFDTILTCGDRLAALPRSTWVEVLS